MRQGTQGGSRYARRWAQGIAATLIAVCAAPAPAAADSHTLAVAATVLSRNKCRFTDAGPTALNFGDIDPSSSSPKTAAAVMSIRCTGSDRNVVYQLASNGGLNAVTDQPRMRHASDPTRFLPYQLDLPQSGATTRNVVASVTVTGSVAPGDFNNALYGAYSDTVTLTILP